ncbi:MAG: acetyl-CoA carboxylase biotin carboxyl carrier protein [Saprospiraceae bacterium]
MDLKEIQELIKMMGKSSLAELKLKQGDFELVLRTEQGNKIQYISAPPQMISTQAPTSGGNSPVQTSDKKTTGVNDQPPIPAASESKLLEIKCPMVGTFYRSPSPDKPPYIKVGDPIAMGQVVCMVEAMKLFNEIESEIAGTVVKIMVEDAAPVEYDQVLFLIEPA